MAKAESSREIKDILKTILDSEIAKSKEWNREIIKEELYSFKRDIVRDMILNKKIRVDGRGLMDVREISIDINLLPMAHSSCLFTRGETQALVVATLGGARDSQMYDLLTESEQKK